jgi:L-fucose isomerase-like protein
MEECRLDAIAVRCWLEMQRIAGISPCVVMSEMNDRKRIASCEVDVGNAVAMYALGKASGGVSACLDWNNNYGEEEDKCILFHCGPVPQSMMLERGVVAEHALLKASTAPGSAFGCNTGRIKPMPTTFSSMVTDAGKLKLFAVEGSFTADPVPDDFFGCAGVAEILGLQDVLLHIGRNGHRHHVSVTEGYVAEAYGEALGYYLGFDVDTLRRRVS